MINVTISIPSAFYERGISSALKETGDFRVVNLTGAEERDVLSACRQWNTDILLLGISTLNGAGVQDRLPLIEKVRREYPSCRIVLILDETLSGELNEGVKRLKLTHFIDSFIYTSASMNYLVDTLETL